MLNTSLTSPASEYLMRTAAEDSTPAITSKTDAREVAKQFEALLIRTMLKSMRSASISDGLLNSDQTDMYLEMFDQKIADEISSSKGFGLQENIYRQLTARIGSSTAPDAVNGSNDSSAIGVLQTSGVIPPEYRNTTDGPGGFINRLRHVAHQTATKLGTTLEAVLAVAALETGWGKKVPTTDSGQSTFNLFGIKADSGWRGDHAAAQTREYRDGELQSEIASFRAYPNEYASVEDFADFLQSNARYKDALKLSANPEDFIRAIHKAGYATDPDYADKVISVMQNVRDLLSD